VAALSVIFSDKLVRSFRQRFCGSVFTGPFLLHRASRKFDAALKQSQHVLTVESKFLILRWRKIPTHLV
jgi:hypothetical protein